MPMARLARSRPPARSPLAPRRAAPPASPPPSGCWRARWRARAPTAAPTWSTSATGQELYASSADVARMPASVEKLYTSATALLLYGADGHLTTVGARRRRCPTRPARSPATSSCAAAATRRSAPRPRPTLAEQLADAGLTRIEGRVVGDESAFDAFRGPPSSSYRTDQRGRPAERAGLQPRPHRQARARTSRPARRASPPRQFEKALERARREDRRQGPRRARADRDDAVLGVGRRRTIAAIVAPDEPALGQLHRRDADQGPRRAVRRRRARPPRGGTVVRDTLAQFGIAPDDRRRLRPLARRTAPRRARSSSCSRAWTRARPPTRSTQSLAVDRPQRHASTTACAAPPPRTTATPRPARCTTSPRSPATAPPPAASASRSRS